MSITVRAVFENGVFRPLAPIEIDEGSQVDVTVTAPPRREGPASPVRFADRRLLPGFAALPPLAGDTTREISADRDRA